MILSEHAMHAALQKVFTVYAVFWVLVVTILLIVTGPLIKRRERGEHDHHHGHGDKH